MHVEATPIEEVGDREHIWRVVIPAASKQSLRDELRWLGITESLLFPDLDRVASVARGLLRWLAFSFQPCGTIRYGDFIALGNGSK
jgi:hypothetical protein